LIFIRQRRIRRLTATRACFHSELQHGAPQLCTHSIGLCGLETIDMKHTFNHVAHGCGKGPICNTYRNDSPLTITTTTNTAIDSHDAWWTAKTGHNKI
jgi:hypothetical protein